MHKINSVTDYHRIAGLPKPRHPLVSLVDYGEVNYQSDDEIISFLQGNYSIALKRGVEGKVHYGQQAYDFDEGLMSFVAPGQILNININRNASVKPSGWLLIINPDFLWNTSLISKIRQYEFFGYNVNEALFLSESEEQSMIEIMQNIRKEYHANIDRFSQSIIISQIELLLNYAERFYQRQFITRKKSSHEVLTRLEILLTDHFDNRDLASEGLPTVHDVAVQLNVSADYLSSLLKQLTGQNTQQHIQAKLIEKAKEMLSTTQLSISEIAYSLGFRHSQSFSRLFKRKTELSPQDFRAAYN